MNSLDKVIEKYPKFGNKIKQAVDSAVNYQDLSQQYALDDYKEKVYRNGELAKDDYIIAPSLAEKDSDDFHKTLKRYENTLISKLEEEPYLHIGFTEGSNYDYTIMLSQIEKFGKSHFNIKDSLSDYFDLDTALSDMVEKGDLALKAVIDTENMQVSIFLTHSLGFKLSLQELEDILKVYLGDDQDAKKELDKDTQYIKSSIHSDFNKYQQNFKPIMPLLSTIDTEVYKKLKRRAYILQYFDMLFQ